MMTQPDGGIGAAPTAAPVFHALPATAPGYWRTASTAFGAPLISAAPDAAGLFVFEQQKLRQKRQQRNKRQQMLQRQKMKKRQGARGGAASKQSSFRSPSNPFGSLLQNAAPSPRGSTFGQPATAGGGAFGAAQAPNAFGSPQPNAFGAAPSSIGQAAGGVGPPFSAQQQQAGMQSTIGAFVVTNENQQTQGQYSGTLGYQCLTAQPQFAHLSFEECRLKDFHLKQQGGQAGQQQQIDSQGTSENVAVTTEHQQQDGVAASSAASGSAFKDAIAAYNKKAVSAQRKSCGRRQKATTSPIDSQPSTAAVGAQPLGDTSVAAIQSTVAAQGSTQDDVEKGASASAVTEERASRHERELRIDDTGTPSFELLKGMREALATSAYGATVELALRKRHHVVVRASSDAALDAVYGKCAAVRDQARESARAPPPNWVGSARPAAGASFALTSVGQGSAEWKSVADAVAITMPAAQLTRLERVQNQSLWDDYAQRRFEVARKSADGFSANEVWGFHGTRSFPVASVCEAGLDFRHASTSNSWGVALYVAANASYSDAYSSDAGNDERQFFYVRAALGRPKEMAKDISIRAPPAGYDSVQGISAVKGVKQSSRVHMLYDLGQAYPEYIVTYRRG